MLVAVFAVVAVDAESAKPAVVGLNKELISILLLLLTK